MAVRWEEVEKGKKLWGLSGKGRENSEGIRCLPQVLVSSILYTYVNREMQLLLPYRSTGRTTFCRKVHVRRYPAVKREQRCWCRNFPNICLFCVTANIVEKICTEVGLVRSGFKSLISLEGHWIILDYDSLSQPTFTRLL